MPFTNFSNGVASFGVPQIGFSPLITGGKVFWVNSNIGSDAAGRGNSNTNPFKTVAFALKQVRGGKGDVILVDQGHVETITGANGWPLATGTYGTINVQDGVTIYGLGVDGQRPQINFTTSTAAQILVAAKSVQMYNLQFDLTGVASIVSGFSITGAGFVSVNCRVVQASASNQALNAFTLSGARPTFMMLDLDATLSVGAATGIAGGAAVRQLYMYDCYIRGNYSSFPVGTSSTFHFTDMILDDNEITQLNGTAKNCVAFTTGSTGQIRYNTFNGTTWTTAADAIGSNSSNVTLRWHQNFGFDDGAGIVSSVLVPAQGTLA